MPLRTYLYRRWHNASWLWASKHKKLILRCMIINFSGWRQWRVAANNFQIWPAPAGSEELAGETKPIRNGEISLRNNEYS